VRDDGIGGAQAVPGAEGRSNSAIAAALGVSPASIEKYVTSIFAKLGLPPSDADHRRVLAVLRYLDT
jgi:DNA-binding NarL/FixJ family response regulator